MSMFVHVGGVCRYVDVPVVGLEVELGLFGRGARDGNKVGDEFCMVGHGGM